jgi:N-acetylglutamate synthase-like GNAT family acetyltransferase
MINIRHAVIDDVPELLPLIDQLGYPTNIKNLERRFRKYIILDGYGVAVACDSTKIIGWVAWSKSETFVLDKTRIHIEGLVIDMQHQKQGVGKKLMAFVEKFAKKYSPVIIDLTSGLRRAKDGSHEFYKSIGYQNERHMAKLYLRKEI